MGGMWEVVGGGGGMRVARLVMRLKLGLAGFVCQKSNPLRCRDATYGRLRLRPLAIRASFTW